MNEIKIYPFDQDRFPVVVTTFQGLEQVLGEEILRLGGEDIVERSRAVQFTGNKKLLYAANYHLRTALRVLRVVGSSVLLTRMPSTGRSGRSPGTPIFPITRSSLWSR